MFFFATVSVQRISTIDDLSRPKGQVRVNSDLYEWNDDHAVESIYIQTLMPVCTKFQSEMCLLQGHLFGERKHSQIGLFMELSFAPSICQPRRDWLSI